MLTITLLGTAATMPLPDRALTAAVAECGGHSLLFDCGEGTQTAARRAGVNLMKMDAVCLTHYHGDHIFGLPGLLQTLGCQGRTRPLALYGPKGLGEVWAALRVLTGPLPYPVYAEVLDAPAALCEKFGGWPQGAKRLWLVHYSPMITDPEEELAQAQSLFPAAECGYDGKSVTLQYEEAEE